MHNDTLAGNMEQPHLLICDTDSLGQEVRPCG